MGIKGMKQNELDRLYLEYKNDTKEHRAAWKCYGRNTNENEYRWEDRNSFINFVAGYEFAMKEIKEKSAKGA
jgi:hypothetical protein